MAATGALTHHAVWVVRELRRPTLRAQSRRYARLAALLAAAQLLMAALAAWTPWAPVAVARLRTAGFEQWFEKKQEAAALALVLAVLSALLYERKRAGLVAERIRRASALAAAPLAWFATIVGLTLTSLLSV